MEEKDIEKALQSITSQLECIQRRIDRNKNRGAKTQKRVKIVEVVITIVTAIAIGSIATMAILATFANIF